MSHHPSKAERALGRVVSGIYILTVGHGENENGMLASWVQQCSLEPLMVSVAVARVRPIADLLSDGKPFTVNILGGEDKSLMKHFAKGFAPKEPAFEGLRVERSGEGSPILLDALGYLECRVRGRCQAGDHDLILGEVIGGGISHEGSPMTHIRKSGTHY